MKTLTINPNDCKAGKPRGVLFRTGVHDRKRNNPKRDRRAWAKGKKDY